MGGKLSSDTCGKCSHCSSKGWTWILGKLRRRAWKRSGAKCCSQLALQVSYYLSIASWEMEVDCNELTGKMYLIQNLFQRLQDFTHLIKDIVPKNPSLLEEYDRLILVTIILESYVQDLFIFARQLTQCLEKLTSHMIEIHKSFGRRQIHEKIQHCFEHFIKTELLSTAEDLELSRQLLGMHILNLQECRRSFDEVT